ncbi:hypothetical protein MM236_04770 [Belliella sp. DSM 107340]|uniref:Uncharacterized protein n=1 Tax=Belliella calami TaxID=2923436 RepID=A0ABS9UL06_9BACT|nr:hypothetical protein [Belliella calami]MCH7397286.1 hypothetical protein [Belliella calami]
MAKKKEQKNEEEAEEWDFSEGFGGIPDDVDLTRNIGCASDSKKGKKSRKSENENNSNKG